MPLMRFIESWIGETLKNNAQAIFSYPLKKIKFGE